MRKYKLLFLHFDTSLGGEARAFAERMLNSYANDGYVIVAPAEERDEEGSVVGWELILEKEASDATTTDSGRTAQG